ncbi:acyl-CoA dehydrogenase family protein [Acidicapsa dinghuensis]|uniref:Acyl-CoA dehydrogenase family protein n=1 Tax=Acidicapsa dinghuensis TaxID=2218256 RepID=A0ABW1EGC4_9BACT|nr:acyl-CoA dehydrogenase family protein [Acidicapsa dinghuensis]
MTVEAGVSVAKRVVGGSFLLEDLTPDDVFTPEDLSEEQRQVASTATSFAEEKILAQAEAIEEKDFAVTRELMRELGELGLLGVDVPEEYGGLAMDKITSAIVADNLSVSGGFSVTLGAHCTIGTMPLVWYGTHEQKAKYLPKLASGEWIAAYALSESSAGSDAMNIRTRAKLSEDGKHYVLNGEKMWISNAGFADLFTVFAKIDGEQFSAFLIERGTPGLSVGAEEHKLGIRGSSTCPLVLEDCRVPVENLLGTAGKGHHIAFNILNVGRYKLAAGTLGGMRFAFRNGVRYAKERVAFGKPIATFGLIQEKIADSAAAIYATESAVYRVVGAIDAALADLNHDSATYAQDVQKRIEEFAVECSILKVLGSEALERVADHALQIHGGYGYVEEYPAERSYRDSRINRIFEGTNEINRLIATGFMIKRAVAGTLPLMPAIKKVMDEVMAGPGERVSYDGPMAAERALLASAKKLALFTSGAASQRFGNDLGEQQEVMGALADILIETLTMESCILRAEKQRKANAPGVKLAKYYAMRAFRVIETAAERVLGAVAEGDMLRTQMTIFRRLAKHEPANAVILGREIAAAMVEAGRYRI